MAPKVGRKFKTRANRNPSSSSSGSAYFDRVRFLTNKCKETYETLTKYRSIWGEREIILSELDPSICRNFVPRNWVSLCEVSDPPPTILIREFYSNLSIYLEMTGGRYLTSWIRGQEFNIKKKTISEVLGVPIVHKPTYPYTVFPAVDNMMSLLCDHPITWGTKPRINSCELNELNSLYLRISCHNIYPISHVHTVPTDRCAFLYALVTNGSMCFPSIFIQTIVDIYRSTSKAQRFFFPMYIYRILRFLGLLDFPPLELVHITAPIKATFLRQRRAQMKLSQALGRQRDYEEKLLLQLLHLVLCLSHFMP